MSNLDLSHSQVEKKVRYAVVGLGWFAQDAALPGFRSATNSELVALVTGDSKKVEILGKMHRATRVYSYDQYDALLGSGSVDAVYITLPNNMHCEFTVRAARSGVHVLCEKPLAETEAECEEMINASRENKVKLMTAYRLHFETANLRAIQIVNSGEIGEPRVFQSLFSIQAAGGNSRLKKALCGGSLMDMGVYCINAARYLFRDEPEEVMGFAGNSGDSRFNEVGEMTSAILRFPGDKLAAFTCSFGAASSDMFQVLGTKGMLRLQPAYDYHAHLKCYLTAAGKSQEIEYPKHDQVGAQLQYFSDCILNNEEPEPSGMEGLADVRIITAILRSINENRPTKLPPFAHLIRPNIQQEIKLPAADSPAVVNASPPV